MIKGQPTEAQIREFWDWCGLTFEVYKEITLDILFEYAVPVLTPDTIAFNFLMNRAEGEKWQGGKTRATANWEGWVAYSAIGPSPALALFWAFWNTKEVWGKPTGKKNKLIKNAVVLASR